MELAYGEEKTGEVYQMGDVSLREVVVLLELTNMTEAMKIASSYREDVAYNNNPRRRVRQLGFDNYEENRHVASIAGDLLPTWL